MSEQRKVTFDAVLEVGLAIAIVLGIVSVVGLILVFPIYKSITASGQVDYCYTKSYVYHTPNQADVVMYELWGFRNWREDRILAQNLKSMDEVKSAAAVYGCQLK